MRPNVPFKPGGPTRSEISLKWWTPWSRAFQWRSFSQRSQHHSRRGSWISSRRGSQTSSGRGSCTSRSRKGSRTSSKRGSCTSWPRGVHHDRWSPWRKPPIWTGSIWLWGVRGPHCIVRSHHSWLTLSTIHLWLLQYISISSSRVLLPLTVLKAL